MFLFISIAILILASRVKIYLNLLLQNKSGIPSLSVSHKYNLINIFCGILSKIIGPLPNPLAAPRRKGITAATGQLQNIQHFQKYSNSEVQANKNKNKYPIYPFFPLRMQQSESLVSKKTLIFMKLVEIYLSDLQPFAWSA